MSDAAQKTYMQALYELAVEDGKADAVLEQITAMNQIFNENPDYLKLLSAPVIEEVEKREMIDNVFLGKIDDYLLNFLKVLSDNGRISLFPRIIDEYEQQYNADNNILKVTAVTAFPMSEKLMQKLSDKIEQVSRKKVRLSNAVDNNLLGGILLKIGDKLQDATVKTRLHVLQEQLKNTVANTAL